MTSSITFAAVNRQTKLSYRRQKRRHIGFNEANPWLVRCRAKLLHHLLNQRIVCRGFILQFFIFFSLCSVFFIFFMFFASSNYHPRRVLREILLAWQHATSVSSLQTTTFSAFFFPHWHSVAIARPFRLPKHLENIKCFIIFHSSIHQLFHPSTFPPIHSSTHPLIHPSLHPLHIIECKQNGVWWSKALRITGDALLHFSINWFHLERRLSF